MDYKHVSVLLHEAVDALRVIPEGKYLDCTFGGGGYSVAIASLGGYVLGVDLDDDALTAFHSRTDLDSDIVRRIQLIKANFDSAGEHAERMNFTPIDGAVFDLGVSSFQLDTASKGFSFMRSGPIDMRLDPKVGISAGRLLDVLDEHSLAHLFKNYSDEGYSKKIAHALVHARTHSPSPSYWEHKSTTDLASFIVTVVGGRHERIHPATRVFQSLRMAVNDEVGNLERGLVSAWSVLRRGGRLVVVSFHSVEDRIVKSFMLDRVSHHEGKIIDRLVTPSSDEVSENLRSRSAKMRIIEKM
jgi:16S rRNA (cytosine1402-N4)-methyltransferase